MLGTLNDVLSNFDESNHVATVSGAHRSPSYIQDLNMIVEELQQSKVFDVVPNQIHNSFRKPKDILHAKTAREIVD